MNRVRLLVLNSVLGVLDYSLPKGMQVEPGSVVIGPLGPRQVTGVVWEEERLPGNDIPESKLRPLIEVLPVPPLSAPLRRLIECRDDGRERVGAIEVRRQRHGNIVSPYPVDGPQ